MDRMLTMQSMTLVVQKHKSDHSYQCPEHVLAVSVDFVRFT